MPIFGKDNKKEKLREAARRAAEKRKEELRKIVEGTAELSLPAAKKLKPYPTEYRDFLREIKRKPLSLYEKAASFSEMFVPFSIDKNFGGIDDSAKAGYLNVTAKGVVGLTIFSFLLSLISIIVSQTLFASTFFTTFIVLIGLIFVYLVYEYPHANARVTTLKMSADSVLAVLYMVIYMRSSPNLEGAIRFASETLSGPLSWDLKKLLWEIQLGTYPNADEAIKDYISKWKTKNEEFAESLNLLRSAVVGTKKRDDMYDQVVNIVLTGTKERTKKYVSGLRMPVALIHAMGVLLPVMGLVLFPIVVIFMAQSVKPIFLFMAYDIILPLFLWFFIDYILRARPPTFSQPDISLAKGVPPLGTAKFGESILPVAPLAVLVALPLMAIGIYGIGSADPRTSVNFSVVLVGGIAAGIIAYAMLDAWQKIKIRKDIERIETEFSVALFQLGNQLNSGYPIEAAIDRSIEGLKGLKIVDLFKITNDNMRRFGYTFEQALFDPKVGAVWYYPSRLVRSVMQTITESSKKGMNIAAVSMITISKYLQGMREVRENVSDVLGETTSSMRFLAAFLAPMVAGVTVTMAVVIMQILAQLSTQLGQITADTDVTAAQTLLVIPWANCQQGTCAGPPVTPWQFQLVVGLYMIETVLLLSMFLNRIEYGEDSIGLRSTIGDTLLFGTVVYILSWIITIMVFGNSIATLLMPKI